MELVVDFVKAEIDRIPVDLETAFIGHASGGPLSLTHPPPPPINTPPPQALLLPRFVTRAITNPSAVLFFLSHAAWAEPFVSLFTALDNYMVYAMHQIDSAIAARAAANSSATSSSAAANTSTRQTGAAATTQQMLKDLAADRSHAFDAMLDRHRIFARDFMPFLHVATMRIAAEMHNLETNNGTLDFLPSDGVVQYVVDAALRRPHPHLPNFDPPTPQDTNFTNETVAASPGAGRRRLLVANGTDDWKQQLGGIPITEAIGFVQVRVA